MNLNYDNQVRRGTIVLLVGAAVLLATAMAWRTFVPAARLVADEPLEQLRRETERLRAYDDPSAVKAKVKLAELRARLWNPARLEEWRRSLPGRWVLQEAQPQPNPTSVTRRFVLTRRGATARDWAEIHALLTAVDRLPTAVVQRLKLAMPQPQSRQFEEVEIIIDLWFERPPPDRGGEASPR